jgi:putative tRNA adenosine deaminase-associated protein
VSYYAVALSRTDGKWTGAELDLDDAGDIDEAVESLREEAGSDADTALLFVESDDEFLAVIRLDSDDDFRVFGSDAAFASESKIGEVLLADLEPVRTPARGAGIEAVEDVDEIDELDQELDEEEADDEDLDDLDEADPDRPKGATAAADVVDAQDSGDDDAGDDSEEGRVAATAGEPVGDPGLLADLGTSATQLLALVAHEGMLPSDVIADVCERAGCAEEYEELRDSATL